MTDRELVDSLRTAPGDDPLERLSRFQGGRFHPVTPSSVDAPYVHVFVHGWQPGFRVQERLLATTDGVHTLPTWDPRLVDSAGRPLISDYLRLIEALEELGEDHAVLWYSWLDESATDADIFLAWRSRQATQVNGRRLAIALRRVLTGAPGNQQLHLIGHSHGSAVVTHAALALDRRPAHLTFLDAPEDPLSRAGGASDLIDVVLPRLRPGRGAGRTFVDSYASAFGRPYHRRPGLSAVVDVQLTPPLAFSRDTFRAVGAAHMYPLDWYARSVRDSHRGVGYGWSPLDGREPHDLHSWYLSPLPQRPLDLRRRVDVPLRKVGVNRRDAMRRTPVHGLALEVTERNPAAAGIVRSVLGDQLVEFDIRASGCTGAERLDVEVDGVPAFTCAPSEVPPPSGRYVVLADSRPGEHLLTARLVGAGPDCTVAVTGIRLVNRSLPRLSRGIGFQPRQTVGLVFGLGAATGSVGTILTLLATGMTARGVVLAIRRARQARRDRRDAG